MQHHPEFLLYFQCEILPKDEEFARDYQVSLFSLISGTNLNILGELLLSRQMTHILYFEHLENRTRSPDPQRSELSGAHSTHILK